MHPLYSQSEIRDIERLASSALPPGALMQRAGQVAANAALDLLPVAPAAARVLVLAGTGNNGGDALEVAAHLAHAGMHVALWLAGEAPAASPERQQAWQRARDSAVQFLPGAPPPDFSKGWDLVIDGLFGIGLKRPLTGPVRWVVEQVNQLDCRILALDVPSGLDADTGALAGPDAIAVRATHTLTFIGDKPGLHTNDGRDHAGTVQVADLDIEAALYPPARAHINQPQYFARHAQARRQNSHKGSFGSVAVIGGAHGMTGAPILAARSALLSGAGRVYIGFADAGPAYDSGQPELMCRHADDLDFDTAVLVVGPGLGAGAQAQGLLQRAIDSRSPLLLDADALNLLAAEPELQAALAQRAGSSVLTPHPLEAARLLGIGIAELQADRLAAARQLAAQLRVTVVLKGSGTVVARVDGAVVINPTGNPALATAGTGDVLSGLCGSLLAQGWPAWQAALASVWLHGTAADMLVAAGSGPNGLSASELLPAIRTALNRLPEISARSQAGV